ncbi:interleukin-24 [Phascolarctos cinereus]|uniref:Interleukin-24 n=1 Tax=Phascolarctos cinereus TaxID=38626 RepID=A0A6P5LQX5_PHACI|nr:interleukin-24 [Phascolarctos cinereus]XP_020858745.1 interleukin-24 [Phascolarctos cinereus]XP_020858746.1 interleukin-24 [Phascolarctos cinereus]XP_020858747.1 interleukin-24 [Phascolarctos cinereus]
MQMAVFSSSMFLLIFLWSTELGAEGQEFHFGHCWVQRAILQDLWRAFQSIRSTVQALDNNTDVRLLRQEFLRNASLAEICHLNYSLLNFYLSNVFIKYHTKAEELGILTPFTTLANNFFAILKKLQGCKERGMFSLSESSQRKFQLFQQEFTKLNPEVRLTKALGEVDILLAWMEKAFRP